MSSFDTVNSQAYASISQPPPNPTHFTNSYGYNKDQAHDSVGWGGRGGEVGEGEGFLLSRSLVRLYSSFLFYNIYSKDLNKERLRRSGGYPRTLIFLSPLCQEKQYLGTQRIGFFKLGCCKRSLIF